MNIINISRSVKQRVKEMSINLLPNTGYVRVTRRGLVILKKHWWSLSSDVVSVTDLCIKWIPKALAEHATKSNKGTGHIHSFVTNISAIVYSSSWNHSFDVVDFLWQQYVSLYVEIPNITVIKERKLLSERDTYLPQLSLFSSQNLYGIDRILRKIRNQQNNRETELLKNFKKRFKKTINFQPIKQLLTINLRLAT